MKVRGTNERPRISVSRSNKYIYAQAIDDVKRVTIVSSSSKTLKKVNDLATKKTEDAKKVGIALAKLMIEKQIKKAVFDRGEYAYNGRVKALAEGLREAGLII